MAQEASNLNTTHHIHKETIIEKDNPSLNSSHTIHKETIVEKRDPALDTTNEKEPSKMHAAMDKLVGGVKETLGTVVHAEGLKESGREQKREGDAEAFAAGKGKKHYDPALARKGVGIQHKHMGPNPKKYTEGPCAGCKDGTCQIGHDYDAAIAHSVTQGHADAGHVKDAGLGAQPKAIHGDNTAVPLKEGQTISHIGEPVLVSANRSDIANLNPADLPPRAETVPIGHHQNIGAHHLPTGAVPVGHNTAYDAAIGSSTNETGMHSKRDHELMANQSEKRREKDEKELKEERKEEKKEQKKEEKKHN